MLFFGYTSDHFSRKWSLFVSTIIIILFAALGAGSYGAGGSSSGLLAALVAYRFFLGIGKSEAPLILSCCRKSRLQCMSDCSPQKFHLVADDVQMHPDYLPVFKEISSTAIFFCYLRHTLYC